MKDTRQEHEEEVGKEQDGDEMQNDKVVVSLRSIFYYHDLERTSKLNTQVHLSCKLIHLNISIDLVI